MNVHFHVILFPYYLLGSFTLLHGILQIDKPGPVEKDCGDAEDKKNSEEESFLIFAGVDQEQMGHQE